MAANGLMFWKDVDVDLNELTCQPGLGGMAVLVFQHKLIESIISGTISTHLQDLYHGAVNCTRKKYNIEVKDVTSVHVKRWFEETERREKRKTVLQREEHIISIYHDIIK